MQVCLTKDINVGRSVHSKIKSKLFIVSSYRSAKTRHILFVCTFALATMAYNWESGAIFELIDMYRDRPMLWDVDREDYRDRSKKTAAWQEIASHFSVDKLVVERKMKILISQYRRELQRGLKGEASKWYAFTRLSFLKATSSANGSASGALPQNQTESEEEKSEDDEAYLDTKSRIKRYSTTSPVPAPSSQTLASVSSIGAGRQRPPSIEFAAPRVTAKRIQNSDSDVIATRKKTRCSAYGTNKMLKMLCKDRKSRDEFAVFGEYVANKLRNIDNCRARNTVQFHINNILYNAELGKFDDATENQKTNKVMRGESSQHDHSRLGDDVDVLSTESSGDSSRILEVQIKQEPVHY